MTDANNDRIWETTINLNSGNYQYKFSNLIILKFIFPILKFNVLFRNIQVKFGGFVSI
jgi:hypothetical protein